MKQIPTKEQVLDALQTHKQLYKAAKSLHVTTYILKKWMNYYGIVANGNVKAEPKEEVHTQRLPWYKRLFRI